MKRASNLPYLLTGMAAFGIILIAWVGRDHFASRMIGPGSTAPMFEASTADGGTATLADFEGQVVLLNVWATWCGPCVYEMPSMQRLYEVLDDERFEIVAVSIDAPVGRRDAQGYVGGDIYAFADSLSLTFPILHDPEGLIQKTYQTRAVPESFLIGLDGMIYRKVSGATEWDRPEHVEFIRNLLEGA